MIVTLLKSTDSKAADSMTLNKGTSRFEILKGNFFGRFHSFSQISERFLLTGIATVRVQNNAVFKTAFWL